MRLIRCLVIIGVVLSLTIGLVGTALAAEPDGKTPATALRPTGNDSGIITGSRAGAFAYYTFDQPGDGSQDTLTLTFSPTNRTVANAVGVVLWQNGKTLVKMNGVGKTPGSNSVTFSTNTAGPILAQVYNYLDGAPVGFQLQVAGVPGIGGTPAAPAAAPALAETKVGTASGTAANPTPLTKPVADTLPGTRAGSFDYYTFDYKGGGVTQNISVAVSPSSADVTSGVYVNVFIGGTRVASVKASSAKVPGQIIVAASSAKAGPALVQVANYTNSTISYTIGLQ